MTHCSHQQSAPVFTLEFPLIVRHQPDRHSPVHSNDIDKILTKFSFQLDRLVSKPHIGSNYQDHQLIMHQGTGCFELEFQCLNPEPLLSAVKDLIANSVKFFPGFLIAIRHCGVTCVPPPTPS